jgi:hypothetical protein
MHPFVRALGTILAVLALAGCAGGPDAQRAQELLERAQAEQLKLRSATFSAEVAFDAGAQKLSLAMEGGAVTKGRRAGDVFVRVVGTGMGSKEFEMTMSKRGDRVTVNANGETQTFAAGDAGAPNLDSFGSLASFDLSSCIEKVDVQPDRSLNGEPATRIAGTVDTSCVLKAATALSGVAGSSAPAVDVDELSKYVDDVRATLFVSERTRLLIGAVIATRIHTMGQSANVQVRYRLTRVNQPLRFPAR